MLQTLRDWLRGIGTSILWGTHTIICSLLICFFAIFKFISPNERWKLFFSKVLASIAEYWMLVNDKILDFMRTTKWQIELPDDLTRNQSYLIFANHQAWADIIALQRTLGRQVPLPRFFIKKQLLWVPFLGAAWWALDFPFMRRYSKEFLEKFPEKRKQDIETIKRKCERFKNLPTSILIFAEGTRFTKKKHKERQSSYKNLLPPKSRGTATVLEVMGEQFHEILDVTIFYPHGAGTFWDFLCGRISCIKTTVRKRKIPEALISWNEENKDKNYEELKNKLAEYWEEKDALLEQYK